MKTHLFLGWALLNFGLSGPLFGQATFELRNRHALYGINAPVFDAQGEPLQGTNYMAELYGGPRPDALAPAMDDTQRRIIVAFGTPGYFSYFVTEVFIPTVGGFGWAWLQVRAWDARLGSTYEEAAARGLGGYGESALFYAQGSGFCGGAPCLPAPLIGLQSFRLRPATPAVLIRGIRRDGDQAIVEWHPGFTRYQLQQTPTLGTPWENVGEPTTATSYTNSISGKAMFFRVAGIFREWDNWCGTANAHLRNPHLHTCKTTRKSLNARPRIDLEFPRKLQDFTLISGRYGMPVDTFNSFSCRVEHRFVVFRVGAGNL